MIKNKINFYKASMFIYLILTINFGINFFLRNRFISIFGFLITLILYIIFGVLYLKEKANNKKTL